MRSGTRCRTIANGELRGLLRNSFSRAFEEGLEAERQAMVRCGATEDARDHRAPASTRPSPTCGRLEMGG
jgi:hypothetical protein